jgi:hypothetical protein
MIYYEKIQTIITFHSYSMQILRISQVIVMAQQHGYMEIVIVAHCLMINGWS